MATKYKTLDQVRSFLNDIPNINSGGCGIAALAMYRWIKKNVPQHVDNVLFHFFHRDSESYNNNKTLLNNNTYNSDNIAIPSHIGIQIKNLTKVIDTYRNLDIQYYGYVVETNSEDVLIKAINNISNWNPMFFRKHNVKKIQKELNIDLSDVDICEAEINIDDWW
jgi:hypothetical protein